VGYFSHFQVTEGKNLHCTKKSPNLVTLSAKKVHKAIIQIADYFFNETMQSFNDSLLITSRKKVQDYIIRVKESCNLPV
jgi:hypothetical protein